MRAGENRERFFCVRLLEQGGDGSAGQRLSFPIGAFLASGMDAIFSRELFGWEVEAVIAGGSVIAETRRGALAQSSMRAIALRDLEIENAMLIGLRLRNLLLQSRAPHLKSISKSAWAIQKT
jgi:hypothetical protein